jgi:hypothetical protein
MTATYSKKNVVFSTLLLKLSIIEQVHQEGELISQLDEFFKWADLIVNWQFPMNKD